MRKLILIGAAAATLLGGCAEEKTTEDDQIEIPLGKQQVVGTAEISDAQGVNVGTITLSEAGGQLVLSVALHGLSAGEKALHLHAVGSCDAPAFKSAGGHLNPFGKSHGHLSTNGPHLGDLPNVEIPRDGSYSTAIPLSESTENILPLIFDNDGTAVVLHAGPDDYKTDPAGAAGPRIACGVLERN